MEGRCGTDALRLSLPPSEIVRRLGWEAGGARLFVGSTMDDQRGLRVPVSRDLAHSVRERLLADATGVRHNPARET